MTTPRLVRVVVWSILLAGASVIPGFLSGAVAPFARNNFELTEVAIGAAFSGFWLIGAITAAPFARLTRRVGAINVLRISSIVLIATSASTATLVHNELGFVIAVSLGGFAPALAVPSASIVIMSIVPPRHQAFALTSASAGSAIGLLGAGFIVSALASSFGWNMTFWVTAALGAFFLVSGAWVGHAKAPQLEPVDAAATRLARSDDSETPPPARRLPRRGALIISLMAVGLTNIAVGAATIFMVSSAPSSQVNVETAALATAIASTASIPVRVLLGIILDRTGKDPLPLVAVLIACGGIGYFLLSTGNPISFFAGIALVLVPGWVWVNVFLYGILARYRENVSGAVGMTQTTFFVGSVIGPLAGGALIAATSYQFSWSVLGVAAFIGLAALIGAKRHMQPFDNRR